MYGPIITNSNCTLFRAIRLTGLGFTGFVFVLTETRQNTGRFKFYYSPHSAFPIIYH